MVAAGAVPSVLPMGVYWPGEYLVPHPTIPGAIDWAQTAKALDDLAARSVTAIWLTHRSAAETAEFARLAARRGIQVVASIAQLAGEEPQVRNGDHAQLIARTMAAWGDAPRPLAWGLGDEPRTSYMNEMAAYVAAWRQYAPGEPLTAVVKHTDRAAAMGLGLDALTNNVYPFFSAGNPNAYAGRNWQAWLTHVDLQRQASAMPWMMGQAYQEPWGPIRFSSSGSIIYQPGSAPHWVMPTPEQVRWQALTAVARGAKGMFFFAYRVSPSPKLALLPGSSLPAVVRTPTDSGAPMGLVHMDGRPTPQLVAMGQAFGWIRRHRPTLAGLAYAPAADQPRNLLPDRTVASVLVDPASGARYLMVVSSFVASTAPGGGHSVTVQLGQEVNALVDLDRRVDQPITAIPGAVRTLVRLPVASAGLFALAEPLRLAAVAAGMGGELQPLDATPTPATGWIAVGDINGDGLGDEALGLADDGLAGSTYVRFGQPGVAPAAPAAAAELAAIAAGSGGFLLSGASAGDRSGSAVAAAGDINGDGLADLLIGAPGADPGGRSEAGISYLVFGRSSTAPLSLSSIAAGRGGFAILGEAAGDRSGSAVAGVGDATGDGLADLTIDAPGRGGRYRIQGGTTGAFLRTAVDTIGSAADNQLQGTAAAETLVGHTGNDTLVGGGGADGLRGGDGDDILAIDGSTLLALTSPLGAGGNTTQLAHIDGGAGLDAIRLEGSDLTFDLRALARPTGPALPGSSRLAGVEAIGLRGRGPNTLV
ncbi:MAG: hypothetical protein ACKOPN_05060, partial [Prochlorococcaceae cyanobacterium]